MPYYCISSFRSLLHDPMNAHSHVHPACSYAPVYRSATEKAKSSGGNEMQKDAADNLFLLTDSKKSVTPYYEN